MAIVKNSGTKKEKKIKNAQHKIINPLVLQPNNFLTVYKNQFTTLNILFFGED